MDYNERQEKLYSALCSGANAQKLHKELFHADSASFYFLIDKYIEEHGLKRQFIIEKALLTPQYGYKLLNGQKHTKNRNVIIRLCLAMGMSLEETQAVIKAYGMPELDESNFRECILMLGIEKKKSIYDIQEWLDNSALEPLIE